MPQPERTRDPIVRTLAAVPPLAYIATGLVIAVAILVGIGPAALLAITVGLFVAGRSGRRL